MTQLSSTLQAHEARANFYQLLDEASDKLRQFTITLRGKTKVVIMPFEEYEGWLETMKIMSDKEFVTSIKKGIKEIKSGKGIPAAKADKLIGW